MEIPASLLMRSVSQIPTITICTDASYDPELGIGTWACYIRTDDKLVKTGKIIEHPVENSTEAERVGIASALWLANKLVNIREYKLILYCDNMSAMHPVRPSTKTGAKKQRAKEQLAFYQKNIEPTLQKALTTDIRHVKGHLERMQSRRIKKLKRHYMNDWCDQEAKRLLIEYRKTIDF